MKSKKSLLSLFAIIVAAVLSVGFVSCGDDDDEELVKPEEEAKIDTTPISILSDGERVVEGADTIISDNEFVAYATKNVIHGFHVGETNVKVNGRAYIKVTVRPQYHLYDDPICNWGCNVAYVKANQKQGQFLSNKSDSSKLFYEDAGAASYLMYSFKNDALNGIVAVVSTNHTTQYAKYLGERYLMTTQYKGSETYFIGMDALTLNEANVVVVLEVYTAEYLMCMYMPASDFSSRSSSESAMKEELRKAIDQLGL